MDFDHILALVADDFAAVDRFIHNSWNLVSPWLPMWGAISCKVAANGCAL
jgi:hypothetical protein